MHSHDDAADACEACEPNCQPYEHPRKLPEPVDHIQQLVLVERREKREGALGGWRVWESARHSAAYGWQDVW